MLIAINANELCTPGVNGVKYYTYNLLKALIDLDSKNKFVLYSKSKFQEEFRLEISKKRPGSFSQNIDFRGKKFKKELDKNFFHKVIKWRLPFWTYTRFPLELRRIKPDVLFMPIQAVPFFLPRCRAVVVVHDLAFLKFPDDFTFKDRLKLSFHTRRAVKCATRIIVPSEATKKDIIKYYGVEPRKIRVIYHGQSKVKSQKSKVKSISQNSKFKNTKYILFVGAIQPRKNIQGLIKAFEIFNTKYKILNTKYKLVIAGPKGWLYKDIFEKARKSKYAKDIIFTGQISREELSEIYRNAEVFVLPSFYEGFGLTILEAMAEGIPVIASNVSSIPEVVGDAGVLVNPYKVDEIAEAIYKIITDNDLRNKLIQKGFKQVQKFSWEKCGKETIEVISEIAE